MATKKSTAKKATRTAKKTAAKKKSGAVARTAAKSSSTRKSAKKTAPGTAQSVTRAAQELQVRMPSSDPVIRNLIEELVQFLEEKKLADIRVMNLEEVNPYFCFFMIATAGSSLQLGTTAREISRRFGEHLTNKKVRPLDVESGWVIHDFVDVVLHLFLEEQRSYYNLEKLWGDAPVIYSAEEPRFQWPRTDKEAGE